MNDRPKPTLSIDFDGTIHSYERGWADGSIYGNVVDGFEEWYWSAIQHFRLVVHSSRDSRQIERWLSERGLDIPASSAKPPAFLTIDDRCVRFDGNWRHPALQPKSLMHFRPWTTLDERPDPR